MQRYHATTGLAYSRRPERKLALENHRLKRKYGIALSDKQKMFDEQKGLCAICTRPFRSLKSSCVDHSHATGRVRKLLCKPCNTYLGVIKENPKVAARLIEYIEGHCLILGD
jgi:hypothetical protein